MPRKPTSADLMERVDQVRRVAHLRQVEREVFDPVAVEGRLGDRLDTERFAGAGRPEDGDVERARSGLASYSRISARMLRKPSISPRSTVSELPETANGNALEGDLDTLEGHCLGDRLEALGVAALEDGPGVGDRLFGISATAKSRGSAASCFATSQAGKARPARPGSQSGRRSRRGERAPPRASPLRMP